MTDETGAVESLPGDDLPTVLHRARQFDPGWAEAAVRGYMREIAAAEAQLDTVDLGDRPLLSSFSASWQEESGP